jgi:prepilin-type N-terminal cleavage/methylation domain-containing protein
MVDGEWFMVDRRRTPILLPRRSTVIHQPSTMIHQPSPPFSFRWHGEENVAMTHRTSRRQRRGGFTLVEMGIVIAIIGILVYFCLAAGAEGLRNAELRATQSLITKLNVAMSERMDALLNTRVFVYDTHNYVGAIPNPAFGATPTEPLLLLFPRRAETIARIEMFRSEVPDVWFPQPSNVNANYPVNMAGQPFPWSTPAGAANNLPGTLLRGFAEDPFVLPMGAAIADNPPTSYGSNVSGSPTITGVLDAIPNETGIFGASHAARAGILKNLGYLAQGYDGVDNNGNGLIDELLEGDDGSGKIQANLANHTHNTARSEMLYALLVEGRGPLGSVFSVDDFTTKEVQDTDGDGLPEFVDAWGQPLQFYRWPVYYTSDSQKGTVRYATANNLAPPGIPVSVEPREKASLDPNLELLAPAWWANITSTTDATAPSYRAHLCSSLFFSLFECIANPGSAPAGTLWDRQGVYIRRREYYTKFLITSSGPDQQNGLYQLTDAQIRGNSPAILTNLIAGDFVSNSPFGATPPTPGESWAVPNQIITSLPNPAIEDDLSSHLLDLPGGGATP